MVSWELPNPSEIPSTAPNFIPLSARASREGDTVPIAFPFQQPSGTYPSPPAAGTTQLLVTGRESPQGGWQSQVTIPAPQGRLLQPAAGLSGFSTYPSTLLTRCCQALVLLPRNTMGDNRVVPGLSESRANPLRRMGRQCGEDVSMPRELQCKGKAGLCLGKGFAWNG